MNFCLYKKNYRFDYGVYGILENNNKLIKCFKKLLRRGDRKTGCVRYFFLWKSGKCQ